MPEHAESISVLNEAVSLEYHGCDSVQPALHGAHGTGRRLFEGLFQEHSRESLKYAKMWGGRIVYLAGVPKAEFGTTHQFTNITEMLEMDLEVDKTVGEIHTRAHKVCQHEPTRYLLSDALSCY